MRYAPRSSVTADSVGAAEGFGPLPVRASMADTLTPTTGAPDASRMLPPITAPLNIVTETDTRCPAASAIEEPGRPGRCDPCAAAMYDALRATIVNVPAGRRENVNSPASFVSWLRGDVSPPPARLTTARRIGCGV